MSDPTVRRWLRPALRALLTPILGAMAFAAIVAAFALVVAGLSWATDNWPVMEIVAVRAMGVLLGVLILALVLLLGSGMARRLIR